MKWKNRLVWESSQIIRQVGQTFSLKNNRHDGCSINNKLLLYLVALGRAQPETRIPRKPSPMAREPAGWENSRPDPNSFYISGAREFWEN